LHSYANNTIVGTSGEYSDLQYTKFYLEQLLTKEYAYMDGHSLSPENIYSYLSEIMYGRRSKTDPLWNSHVVGGFHKGKPFLGYVDLLGTTYKSSTIATGFGSYLAIPLLRKQVEGREAQITEAEAKKILEDCMRVLYYRDARSLNNVRFSILFNLDSIG
jgi:20S proteasome subunit beta 7